MALGVAGVAVADGARVDTAVSAEQVARDALRAGSVGVAA